MINIEIFKENIKIFLLNFNFEFKTKIDLQLYITTAYTVFEYHKINEKQFIEGIQKIILTKQRKDLYGRPAPLDLIDMMGLKEKELKPEEIARAEFYKALELSKDTYKKSDLTDTSKHLIKSWDNPPYTNFWWKLDKTNENREDLKWILKEWIDGWLAIYDRPFVLNSDSALKIANNRPMGIENGMKNLISSIKITK